MRPERTPEEWAEAAGLKREGRDYVGPCPLCGGTDRFHVKAGRVRAAVVGCRGCDGPISEWEKAVFGDSENGPRAGGNGAGRPRTPARPVKAAPGRRGAVRRRPAGLRRASLGVGNVDAEVSESPGAPLAVESPRGRFSWGRAEGLSTPRMTSEPSRPGGANRTPPGLVTPVYSRDDLAALAFPPSAWADKNNRHKLRERALKAACEIKALGGCVIDSERGLWRIMPRDFNADGPDIPALPEGQG